MDTIFQNSLILLRKSKVLLVLSILPALAFMGLILLPLFRDFDYELNEAVGVIVFLTAMGIAIAVERQFASEINPSAKQIVIEIPKTNLYIFKYSLCIIFLGLVTPLIFMFSFLFFYETCSLTRGLQFFLLLPVTSAVIGCSLGYVIVVLFKKFAWIAAVCLLILSLTLNLFWLKLNVPIYVYSVFWGYFPGPLYDEWIPVTSTLWIHRFWSLCFAALFVVTAFIWKQKPVVPRTYIIAFLSILALIFGIYEMRFRIGFDAGYDDVSSELGANIKSEHISIIFDQNLNKAEMEWIRTLSEYYYEQISRFLDLKSKRLITIYVHRDEYQKKQLMGAGRTNFAKIINDEVHINYDDIGGVLKHEMTHVLANDFGNDIYSTARIGFLEGLAVAAEWNEDYFTPHEWAAALKKQNKLPDVLPLIDGSGFFKSASGMSYIVSGSFTRFLIDSFGVTMLKRAYHDEDIEKVYGVTKPELAGRWMSFLDSISIRDEDIQLAGLLLQPSLFQKKCPHYVADILEEAGREYANGEYLKAAALYQKALHSDKENYRILIAQIKSRFYAGESYSALHSIDSLLTNEKPNFVSRASLRLLKGDMLLRSAKSDSALIEYQHVVHNYKNIPYIYVSAKLRVDFLNQGLDETLKSLVATLNTDEQEMVLKNIIDKNPDLLASRFWLARLCFQRSAFTEVISLIENPEEMITDETLAFERLGMLADSYLRLAKYDPAENCLEESNKLATRSMDRELITQRMALLNWLERRSN